MNRFERFLEQLRCHASSVAVQADGRSHTYADLLLELELWQARFDRFAVSPGTTVGLRADYSLTGIAALLALFSRRAVAVLIPGDRDASWYAQQACASLLVELSPDGSCRYLPLERPPPHPLLERLCSAGQAGIVVFTSGSTGLPKAALHSLERFLHKFSKSGAPFRTLAFMLFDHVAGLDTLFHTLASGGTLVVTRRRDPQRVCEIIELHQVEVLPSSPTFLRLLCAARPAMRHDLSSLKIITYGAEPMDADTLQKLNASFPAVRISQKYGTTETGAPRCISRGNDSLWLKIDAAGAQTKVVNGVLWIRSESAILGYLNFLSPLDEEGWYCTGDLVDVDGEWIRFRGRESELINVGGEKVSPAEVEQAILRLDFVCTALVAGEPHPIAGQIVTARVTLMDSAMDPRDAARRIRAHCRQHLSPHKVPVKVSVDATPAAGEGRKTRRPNFRVP